MTRLTPIVLTVLALALTAGTVQATDATGAVTAPKPKVKVDAALAKIIQESFISESPATVEGVTERDDIQKVCSQSADHNTVPAIVAKKLEDVQFKAIHYPADNTWLDDWKEGERTTQSGHGMQFSDPASTVNGASCYACHRLSKDELSYDTTSPSLYQYGGLRGDSETTLCYTWGKTRNSNAYATCLNMPRFGHKGILTEQQIRDVMVPLFDPAPPVSQRSHNAIHTLRRFLIWTVAVMVSTASTVQAVEMGGVVVLPGVQSLDGTRVPSGAWRGYPVIIATWASWRPFCALQNPHLQELYDVTCGTGLRILTINTDASPQLAGDCVVKRGFTFPVTVEIDTLCAAAGPRKGPPELLVLDAEDRVARKGVGKMLGDDAVSLTHCAHSPKQ